MIPQRLHELAEVVKRTPGFEYWQPDYSSASLDTLGEWFATQVETRNRTKEEIRTIENRLIFQMEIENEELTSRTFSLAMDIGMYLSQVFLKNYPSLRLEQACDDKKLADYGQPLIAGFGPLFLNPVRIAITLAYGLARKNETGKRLREVYDYWAKMIKE